jgi:hypothetical protein
MPARTMSARTGQQALGIAQIARETGLSRKTVYSIKDDRSGECGGGFGRLGDVGARSGVQNSDLANPTIILQRNAIQQNVMVAASATTSSLLARLVFVTGAGCGNVRAAPSSAVS